MKDSSCSCAPERRLYGRNACKRAKQAGTGSCQNEKQGRRRRGRNRRKPVKLGGAGLRRDRKRNGGSLKKMGKRLYGVGNRTHEKAVEFARTYGVEKVYDRPEDMFEDPAVDIIYLTTPHNTHMPFLRQALGNGKHVLCEKSITLNSAELEEAMALAEKTTSFWRRR